MENYSVLESIRTKRTKKRKAQQCKLKLLHATFPPSALNQEPPGGLWAGGTKPGDQDWGETFPWVFSGNSWRMNPWELVNTWNRTLFTNTQIFFINLLIYLPFIFGCAGSLGCTGFSLVVVSQGCSLVAVCGLLFLVASLVAEHRL